MKKETKAIIKIGDELEKLNKIIVTIASAFFGNKIKELDEKKVEVNRRFGNAKRNL